MKVWRHLSDLLTTDGTCAMITVAGTAGSTPRETGARMVVRSDGGFYGTIGGGTLELQAIGWATSAIENGKAGWHLRTFSLGPDLGQCCGGRADVAVEVFTQTQSAMAAELAALEDQGRWFSTCAVVREGRPVQRSIGASEPSQAIELSADGILHEHFGEPRRELNLFGAGHVGRAVVLALAPLPFRINWIDNRTDAFPAAVPPNVTKIQTREPAQLAAGANEDSFVLVMTHSHALDEEIIASALLRQTIPYVGLIGSATKRKRFEKRLLARGIAQQAVSAMVCPVGTRQIVSKAPAAIAAGIAVELLIADQTLHLAASRGLAQPIASGQ
ncbi:xanthine dehydrogenase accessory protein XdhC [Roseibium sp.]|uniref:xanthine dehydrogenase accessory protein XdhC n=1 Tax=Roseibium sp. TaxID=1936156 RepID=UPI003A970C89